MQQKVQSAVCDPEPGTASVVGEFQNVEAPSRSVPCFTHPPQKDVEVQLAANGAGSCSTSCVGRCSDGRKSSFPARVLICLVRGYQLLISPWFPPCCRFTPSCSNYAIEALRKRGFWMGSFLTVWRLLRCQPFVRGGYDPVPDKKQKISSPPESFNSNEEK